MGSYPLREKQPHSWHASPPRNGNDRQEANADSISARACAFTALCIIEDREHIRYLRFLVGFPFVFPQASEGIETCHVRDHETSE